MTHNKYFFSGRLEEVRAKPGGGNVPQDFVHESDPEGPHEKDVLPLAANRDPFGAQACDHHGHHHSHRHRHRRRHRNNRHRHHRYHTTTTISTPAITATTPTTTTTTPPAQAYNLNPMLLEAIRMSDPFWDMAKMTTFSQVIDAIYYNLHYVTPWVPGTHKAQKTQGMQVTPRPDPMSPCLTAAIVSH